MKSHHRKTFYAVMFFDETFGVVLIGDFPAADNLVLIELVETAVINTLAAASTFAGAEVFVLGTNAQSPYLQLLVYSTSA